MDETGRLGFKVVDENNVLDADPIVTMLATMTPDGSIRPTESGDFIRRFAEIDVEPHVPHEVQRGFLFARNAMCYGYWCYGLMTLGGQQMLRVADDALAHALIGRGVEKRLPFAERIRRLIAFGDIPADDETKWDALRRLRNSATHQKFQQIWSPADAVRMASTIATLLARVAWRDPAGASPSTNPA
jgi:hypothetical protein